MKVRFCFAVLLVMFLACGCAYFSTASADDKSQTNDQKVNEIIATMTPSQKVGQLLMLGILETEITPNLQKRISTIKPGFLILFRKNIITPVQTSKLLYGVQSTAHKASNIQMIVAVDQEGGDVVRIPTSPALPTALAMGRSGDLQSTFKIGKYIGEVLNVMGIHMNLAPVLDLSDPEKVSFIQTRSFGADPKDVSVVSNEFARGVQSSGVLSTAKHFPGLGHLKEDSHKTIVQNPVTKAEFFKSYLKPYQKLIKENSISAIMMTHLIYPNLDPSMKPATFSSEIINIIKERLQFKGLIVTDDVEMAGAKFYSTAGERAVQAFLAGNDVLMVAWNKSSQRQAHQALLKAYEGGIISEERLNSSLKKIIALKETLKLTEPPAVTSPRTILTKLRDNALKEPVNKIFEKIFNDEVTRINPKITAPTSIAVMSAEYSFYRRFISSYGKQSQFVRIRKKFDLKKSISILRNASMIIANVSGPSSARIVNNLPPELKKKSVVINSRYLGSIKNEDQFLGVMQISMKHPDMGVYIGSYLDSKTSGEEINRSLSSEQKNSDTPTAR